MTATLFGVLQTVLGAVAVWFGIHRLVTWPPSKPVCGNCWFAHVGIPVGLGLLGLVLVAGSLLCVRYNQEEAMYWSGAIVGLLSATDVVGIPFFAICWTLLALSVLRKALRA